MYLNAFVPVYFFNGQYFEMIYWEYIFSLAHYITIATQLKTEKNTFVLMMRINNTYFDIEENFYLTNMLNVHSFGSRIVWFKVQLNFMVLFYNQKLKDWMVKK